MFRTWIAACLNDTPHFSESVIPPLPPTCLWQLRPGMNNVLRKRVTARLVKGGAASNDSKQALEMTFPKKGGR